jgi:predicted nuclease of predicted toxin-antitoxin system
MKFLADMGIAPQTAAWLCRLGHEAVHLIEQGLERLTDAAIIEKARLESRIVLTHDLDFPELIAASGTQLPSVIIFRLRRMRPSRVQFYLQNIITDYAQELERGAIISVTEAQIRVRSLPLK